ncbi:chemotaxis protein CheW [uncultured Pseudokineococcus sp.]|uniref:chemotaxis protein CheW n=1 Tax=uncultured Pseudokineococcus sp. TaxID=1642928 RepID=UPI00260919C8|nr:chemotaxis protein CheW [uncultured Pseudokineococcus sp.]
MDDGALEGMDEIVSEFLVESEENLDELDQQLVALEADPSSRQLLAGIFRTIHTIKGTSGFLAFSDLERLAHVGETLLARLRDGRAVATPQTVTVLLHMVDAVRGLLGRIEATGSDAGADLTGVLAEITAELEGAPAPAAAAAPSAPAAPAAEAAPSTTPAAAAPAPEVAPAPAPTPDPAPAAPAPTAPAPAAGAGTGAAAAPVEPPAALPVPALAPDPVLDAPAPVAEQPAGAPSGGAPAGAEEPAPARRSGEASVRVDVELLEQLMSMVGELVLTRNQVLERASSSGDAEMLRAAHRLDLVAGELQQGVMQTRMQPIDHVWSKLPRVVRDLGAQLGRQVRLEMEGADTELDRTLLEAVKDPLTHLVRNAVDHGLEPPEDRRAARKDPVGLVTLRARHEGGQVLVEVSDDGRGMDPRVIGARALERGLVDEATLRKMSTTEVLGLVFTPGFSTAAAVTSVSGRGVGMDVVRTNIERIGGSIELESVVGRGSTTRLRVPLTLAIIPALVVSCGGQRFAIPQNGLRELVGLDRDGGAGTEHVGDAEVHRLRGHLLPLVRLHDALALGRPEPGESSVVAVLETAGRRFGLVVDAVLATQEIVVKPLGALLGDLPHYSGATILGDGGLALILDVQALSRSAREQERADERAGELDAGPGDSTQLLLVRVGSRRMAIPLEVVTRLEDVPRERLERIGRRWAVQHRGEVMPVLVLAEHLGELTSGEESVPLVVHAVGGRSVALAVDEILDVTPAAGARVSHLGDPGLSGSAVVDEHIVELLDVRQAVLAADATFYDEVETPSRAGAYAPPRPRSPRDAHEGARA